MDDDNADDNDSYGVKTPKYSPCLNPWVCIHYLLLHIIIISITKYAAIFHFHFVIIILFF